MIILTTILCIAYSIWILFLALGMLRLPKANQNKTQSISLIIAARNEEKNLPALIDHLTKLSYPKEKFEIIIADDRSTDNSPEMLKSAAAKFPNLKYIRIEKEQENFVGKKNALAQAIEISSFDILAFTDADCYPRANWLQEINSHFTDEINVVSGYSPLIPLKKDFVSDLKSLERAAIFAVNAGSFGWNIAMTTTARNFAYRRSLYKKTEGYTGISHIRSGDDDLMLQKMIKHVKRMNFMFGFDSIVPTADKSQIKEQIHLETRRASKFKYYPNWIKLMLCGILGFYLCYIITFFMAFFNTEILQYWLMWTGAKLFAEFSIISLFLFKIKEKKKLFYLPFAELLYIPYFIFFGLKGTFGNYKWKN